MADVVTSAKRSQLSDALGAQVAEGAGLGLHGMSLIKIDRARRGLCGACWSRNMNQNPLIPS